MGDQWPWEAKELMPQESFTLYLTSTEPMLKCSRIWLLKSCIVGRYCIARWGKIFTNPFGELVFLGQQCHNETMKKTLWKGKKKQDRDPTRLSCHNPFSRFPSRNHSWYQLEAPNSYKGRLLGTPLMMKSKKQMRCRHQDRHKDRRWKDTDWPPERIILWTSHLGIG
ncbi:Endogenous retrovirus group 3 member 1 Env polyprotein [Plecturocebus cupreus]